MSEALKAVVWRFLEEIWHQGNLQVIDEIIAPNYVRHTSHYREGGHALCMVLKAPDNRSPRFVQPFPMCTLLSKTCSLLKTR